MIFLFKKSIIYHILCKSNVYMFLLLTIKSRYVRNINISIRFFFFLYQFVDLVSLICIQMFCRIAKIMLRRINYTGKRLAKYTLYLLFNISALLNKLIQRKKKYNESIKSTRTKLKGNNNHFTDYYFTKSTYEYVTLWKVVG